MPSTGTYASLSAQPRALPTSISRVRKAAINGWATCCDPFPFSQRLTEPNARGLAHAFVPTASYDATLLAALRTPDILVGNARGCADRDA